MYHIFSNKLIKFVLPVSLFLLLICYYIFRYQNLNRGLYSCFDEGFFYNILNFSNFSADTQPLTVGHIILKSLFNISVLDVLSLRQLDFLIKLYGLLCLIITSIVYIHRKKLYNNLLLDSLILACCMLLSGIFLTDCMVINCNSEATFFVFVSISFLLLSLVAKSKMRHLFNVLMFSSCTFLLLCNAVAGSTFISLSLLLLLLSSDSMSFKKGFLLITDTLIGIIISIGFIHFFIIDIADLASFFDKAISLTASNDAASHHSFVKISIKFGLGIRDVIITILPLFGISYIYSKLINITTNRWVILLLCGVIFCIIAQWMAKPMITYPVIIMWLSISFLLHYANTIGRQVTLLFIFIMILPIALSFGTNTTILSKAIGNCVTMGIVFYFIYFFIKNNYFMKVIYMIGIIFLTFLYSFNVNQDNVRLKFDAERPISKMYLNMNQFLFYNEIYSALKQNGYKSKQDTILSFCYNEMTVVAMDAIPYTNDQQPEEFFHHNISQLPAPQYMILTEWDSVVLYNHFSNSHWNFPENYKKVRMSNVADPNNGYEMTKSVLYCRLN